MNSFFTHLLRQATWLLHAPLLLILLPYSLLAQFCPDDTTVAGTMD